MQPPDNPAAWYWLAWVVAFVVLELGLWLRYGTRGTFSWLLWHWQDAGPGGWRWRRVRWLALAGALAVFGWHFLAGAW